MHAAELLGVLHVDSITILQQIKQYHQVLEEREHKGVIIVLGIVQGGHSLIPMGSYQGMGVTRGITMVRSDWIVGEEIRNK